jgi:hypothetical protein
MEDAVRTNENGVGRIGKSRASQLGACVSHIRIRQL